MKIARSAAVVLVLSLLLGACSSTVDGQGTPAEQASTSSRPTEANPQPAPPIGAGTVVESHRIAGATLLISGLLPALTDNCNPSGPVVDAAETEDSLGLFPPGTAADILSRYGFVAGWAYCRSAADVRSSTLFVAELSDPDSASVASDELAAALAVDGYQAAELPDLPDGRAILREDSLAEDGQDASLLQVLLPVDRMLVYLFHADLDTEQAGTNASAVLSQQVELLAGFQPTPQDQIAALDPDPFGLAVRAADPPGGLLTNFSGSYDLDSYLRVAIAPERERVVLVDNGYVGTYVKQTVLDSGRSYQIVVYEMGSMAEADATFTEFRTIETEEFDGVRFTVPEDLTIPCFYFQVEDTETFYQRCYTREGRYLASIDVFGVTNPFDIAEIRTLNAAQIQAMRG